MKFENVSPLLKQYIQSKHALAPLLPFAAYLLYACLLVDLLDIFVSMPSVISTVFAYLFYLVLVLLVANADFLNLTVAFGGELLFIVISIIRTLVSGFEYWTAGSVVSWILGRIIVLFVYGLLAYLAFKKWQLLQAPASPQGFAAQSYPGSAPPPPQFQTSGQAAFQAPPPQPPYSGYAPVICSNCGATLVPGVVFCPNCGQRV